MSKPNIIFILSDDQGAWAMHCAGNEDIITPNLDRIAKNGIRFENFFCASPVCSPARASIVTGEIPSCHGVIDWLKAGNANTENHPYMKEHQHFKEKDVGIEYLEGRPSYIAELAKNGYTCAQSGKWHLGNSEKAKEGFEKWFTIYGGGCGYYDADTFENGHFTHDKRYVTDIITEKAIEYLDGLSGENSPFYLGVHYTAPHSPWDEKQHPKEFIDMYRDSEFNATPKEKVHPNQITSCQIGDTEQARKDCLRGYYAAITAMDYNIGKILDRVEEKGIADNTIIVFMADNGMNLGHHGIWGKGNGTYPQNMYDTSVKVPLLISAPFMKNKGIVAENLLSQCDFFPTLMELAQINYQSTQKQSGKSFASVLRGDNSSENEFVAVSSEYGSVRMLRNKKRKLVMCYIDGNHQYFNLENDADEKINLIDNSDYADEIAQMKLKLEEFFEKYSRDDFDARKFFVSGSGQLKMCNDAKSFSENLVYFDKSRNK